MGLSSQKTTTGPSKQALPHLNMASSALTDTYKANAPRLGEISDSLFDAYKTYSSDMGSDLEGTRSYMGDVLGGKYLTEGNPYLQGMIDQTNDSVTDRINALFSSAGQTGSSRQIGELGKQLADAENRLRYQSYGDEMERMGQAAALGLSLNQATNTNAATQGALGASAAEIPYIGAEKLAQGLGGLWSNSQTTKQSGGLGQMLLGAGAQLGSAAIMASDRRLKTKIAKIGELADGLGVYLWRYIWEGGDQRHVGVMADEVENLRPWALGPRIMGEYATVNYGAL